MPCEKDMLVPLKKIFGGTLSLQGFCQIFCWIAAWRTSTSFGSLLRFLSSSLGIWGPESPNFLRKWFYEGRRPIAVQHGLRLAVVGTGSIGYFSIGQLATQDRVGKICDTVLKSNMARGKFTFSIENTSSNRAFFCCHVSLRG